MSASASYRIPIVALSSAGSTLVGSDGRGAFVIDLAKDDRPRRIGSTEKAGELKSELVRLVALRKAQNEGGVVESVVTTVGEDKQISMYELETGRLVYKRTAIKKLNALSVEQDKTVIVSDKVGDVFAYPYVDDEKVDPAAEAKARPDAVSLAGDPSLNPDADLLVGHVSVVTAHMLTPDGKELITADRDEHIRISRYPEGHIIERFLFGHSTFVSALCIPPSQPALLLSAGGDPTIIFHSLSSPSPHPLFRLPIGDVVQPYRAIRPLMRRLRRRKDASAAQRDAAPVEEVVARFREMRARGPPYTEEEMGLVPEGYLLPMGEGVCVTKMEAVGEDVVFFSEGCTAIHTFRLPHDLTEDAAPPDIRTFDFSLPVLTFTTLTLPADSQPSRHLVIVSLDPLWRDRVDGGKALELPLDAVTANKQKKATNGEANGNEEKPQAINEAEGDLRVLEISEAGELVDVTAGFSALTAWRKDEAETAPLPAIHAVPLYSNLTVLPKWLGDDEDGAADEAEEPALDGLGKRALGQLRAKGVDVDAKMSEWHKERKQTVKQQKDREKQGKGKKRKVEKAEGNGDVDMEEMMNA